MISCDKCQTLKQRFKELKEREETLEQKLRAMDLAVSKLVSENDRLEIENSKLRAEISMQTNVDVDPKPQVCESLISKAGEIMKSHTREIIEVTNQRNALTQKCCTLLKLGDRYNNLIQEIPNKLQRLVLFLNSEGVSKDEIQRDWRAFGFDISGLLTQNEHQKQRAEGLNALSDVLSYLQNSGMDSKTAEMAISFIKSLMKTQKELIAEIDREKRKSEKMSAQLAKVRMEIGAVNEDAVDGIELSIQEKLKELKKRQATSEEASKHLKELFELIDEIEPDYEDIKEYILKMRKTSKGREKIRELLHEVGDFDLENDKRIIQALEQVRDKISQMNREHQVIDTLISSIVPAASSEANYVNKLKSLVKALKSQSRRDEEHRIIDELETKVTGQKVDSQDYVERIRRIMTEVMDHERLKEVERKLEEKRQKIRELKAQSRQNTQEIAKETQERMEQQERLIRRIKRHLKLTTGSFSDIVRELKRLHRMRMSGAISEKRMRQIILRIVSHLSIYTDPRLAPQKEQLLHWLQISDNGHSLDIYAPIDQIFNTIEDLHARKPQIPVQSVAQATKSARSQDRKNEEVQTFAEKHTPFMRTRASSWPEYCKELIYRANHEYVAPIPKDVETYFVQQLRLQKKYLMEANNSESVSDAFAKRSSGPVLSLRTLVYVTVFIQMTRRQKFPDAVAAIERLKMIHPFAGIDDEHCCY